MWVLRAIELLKKMSFEEKVYRVATHRTLGRYIIP